MGAALVPKKEPGVIPTAGAVRLGGEEGGPSADAKRSSSFLEQCGSADSHLMQMMQRNEGPKSLGSRRRNSRSSGALIAPLRCDTPTRCGAFADERRIVAATKADAPRTCTETPFRARPSPAPVPIRKTWH